MPADVGEKAPDFALPSDSWDQTVSLEGCTGERPVVLFFFPFLPEDRSSVCTGQLSRVPAEIGGFEEKGARVMAISANHRAWAEVRGSGCPLLPTLEREAVDHYGVRHEHGHPQRAYPVIDREDVSRAKKAEPSPKDQPDVEAVLRDVDMAL